MVKGKPKAKTPSKTKPKAKPKATMPSRTKPKAKTTAKAKATTKPKQAGKQPRVSPKELVALFQTALEPFEFYKVKRAKVLDQFISTHDGNDFGEVLLYCINRYMDHEALVLVERGAWRSNRDAVLEAAGRKKDPAVVKALADAGAPLEKVEETIWWLVNLDDKSPGFAPRCPGASEVLRWLLSKGFSPDQRSDNWPTNPSILMRTQNVVCANVLLDAGADVNARDEEGNTALHHAAEIGHERLVALFVKRGARTDARNKEGKTAAQVALAGDYPVVAAQLDPALAGSVIAKLPKQRLRGHKLPQALELLWRDYLAGQCDFLVGLNELALLGPDDNVDDEGLGVPKKRRSTIAWFATEADGALVGYDLSKGIESSVIKVDNEGQATRCGRTLAEFLMLAATDAGDPTPVMSWLAAKGLRPDRSIDQIRSDAEQDIGL